VYALWKYRFFTRAATKHRCYRSFCVYVSTPVRDTPAVEQELEKEIEGLAFETTGNSLKLKQNSQNDDMKMTEPSEFVKAIIR
jgi:hypothetical protein